MPIVCAAIGLVLVGCTLENDNPMCGCASPIVSSTFSSFDVPAVARSSDTLLAIANNPGCSRYSHTYSYRAGDTLLFGPNYDRQSCALGADTTTTFTLDSVEVLIDSTMSSGVRFFRFTIGRKGFADSIATVGVTIL